ncbi:hypothetical protein BDV18DRAFT_94223 [Aspergillus unguis]
MHIDRMAVINDDVYQHSRLPPVRSISTTSSPVDMSGDRRLPPLPPREPLHRDLFNFTQKTFMPSPPSMHESFPAKSPWPPVDTIVPPLSPASSAGSLVDSVSTHGSAKWRQEIPSSNLIDLLYPNTEKRNRKMPLQQVCGRKRKSSEVEEDVQREKHRVAEGKRRQNLSGLLRETHSKVPDRFLEMAGWDPKKNQTESKEHIVAGANMYTDFLVWTCSQLLHEQGRLPSYLQENIEPKVRCIQLERVIPALQQQVHNDQLDLERYQHHNKKEQQQTDALERENLVLKERMRELEYRLRAQEQHPSRQQIAAPDTKSLPGLRGPYDGPETRSPASARSETLSDANGRVWTFLNKTPPATGPSSPTSPQATFPMSISPISHPASMS